MTANKHVLTGPQPEFDELRRVGGRRLLYETTVGAGLPVIGTVASLLATGDIVLSISGLYERYAGVPLRRVGGGTAVLGRCAAGARPGFYRAGSRADLSGRDVARKALILARLLGQKRELGQVPTESLYPESLAGVPVDEFLRRLRNSMAGTKGNAKARRPPVGLFAMSPRLLPSAARSASGSSAAG